jgi:ribonuclease Y
MTDSVASRSGSSKEGTSTSRSWPSLPTYFVDDQEQARRLIALVVARQASRFVSQVSLERVAFTPSQLKDGIKARIVGKEGRNVRYFEDRAGVSLLLNEEPGAVLVSCFDPFRREVAREALALLAQDGRIQPARIDECLAQARRQVDEQVRLWGAQAAEELQLAGFHPAVLRVLGTLKLRHSFGQNQLAHAIETAWLCGQLAAELGFDTPLARRAALLHDLGKALDQTHEGAHAEAGARFAEAYGESPEVVHAIACHHEEFPPQTWLDHLVIAADALSGARPGARAGSTQTALDRATQMEQIAQAVPGVTEAYAVQAGRELRVFVDGQQVSDEAAGLLAREVARQIAEQVQFPGQIQVTLLRELRWIEKVSEANPKQRKPKA